MAEDIENFKNRLIKYLHENYPNIDIKFSDEAEIGNAFLLDVKERVREKTTFYEVSITKHIGSNEYEIAKAYQQQLEKALITNDEKIYKRLFY